MDITQENCHDLTPQIIEVLDDWNLSAEQILIVLGLSSKTASRDLRKYRAKTWALPLSPDLVERVAHIGGIVDALRTTFPFSAEFRAMWLRQPHRRFDRETPLNIMLNEGLAGLEKVRVEVDCAYGWAAMAAVQKPA